MYSIYILIWDIQIYRQMDYIVQSIYAYDYPFYLYLLFIYVSYVSIPSQDIEGEESIHNEKEPEVCDSTEQEEHDE